MTTNKPQLGAGDVTIMLEGEELVLRPSLQAAQFISRQTDGIRGAMSRCMQMDLDAITMVIGQGLGYSPGGPEIKKLPQRIFNTGLSDDSGGLLERTITFLRVLASGGRLPTQPPGTEGASDDTPRPLTG